MRYVSRIRDNQCGIYHVIIPRSFALTFIYITVYWEPVTVNAVGKDISGNHNDNGFTDSHVDPILTCYD